MKMKFGITSQKQLWTTRLGARNTDGTLRAESMEASYQAFRDIKKLADQYGAEYCFGFATSAVREAANGLEFMEHDLANIVRWMAYSLGR